MWREGGGEFGGQGKGTVCTWSYLLLKIFAERNVNTGAGSLFQYFTAGTSGARDRVIVTQSIT